MTNIFRLIKTWNHHFQHDFSHLQVAIAGFLVVHQLNGTVLSSRPVVFKLNCALGFYLASLRKLVPKEGPIICSHCLSNIFYHRTPFHEHLEAPGPTGHTFAHTGLVPKNCTLNQTSGAQKLAALPLAE